MTVNFRDGLLRPGLAEKDFRAIARNGVGDQLNSYPHSMTWFNNRLILGTTRSNLCLFKVSKISKKLDRWPVECPDNVYDQDMRARVLQFDAAQAVAGQPNSGWTETFTSPLIDADGEILPREIGYRAMCVFQGKNDAFPHLFAATYTPARGQGARILRSADGYKFDVVPMPANFGDNVTTLRLIVPFKGKLFTSPTGAAGGNVNAMGNVRVFATDDPMSGAWEDVNIPGFGDPTNVGIFEMIAVGDWLYAGTGNPNGYQIWRTKGEGKAPYTWDRVITDGAYRGPLNQGVASFCVHEGVLYAGSGIQHGGIDRANKVGPAGPELIRIYEDGTWDLITGRERDTPDGMKVPISGYSPGFNSMFAGYFWRMESHEGWLYLGTFDWLVMLRYSERGEWPVPLQKMLQRYDVNELIRLRAGADLYRSRDGENWLPVTQQGFGNPYNYGVRTLQSTPHGLAVGLVNPFGPRVGLDNVGGEGEGGFGYVDNPDGGLEVWLGRHGRGQ